MASATKDVVGGAWLRLKGRLREAWGALTDDDRARARGQLDQLIGTIRETAGLERSKRPATR